MRGWSAPSDSRPASAPRRSQKSMLTAMVALCLLGPFVTTADADENGPKLPPIYSYRAEDIASLRKGFANPPREAGPWVYWFWFDNVVSRREITRELEEMAEAGIAGVELRCVSMHGFAGRTPGPWFDPKGWERLGQRRYSYLSPEFVGLLEHTLTQARRLGLRFAINLGMGWPPGGRWITGCAPIQTSARKGQDHSRSDSARRRVGIGHSARLRSPGMAACRRSGCGSRVLCMFEQPRHFRRYTGVGRACGKLVDRHIHTLSPAACAIKAKARKPIPHPETQCCSISMRCFDAWNRESAASLVPP